MAFPQVAAVNGGNDTVNRTDHTVNLPAGIQAGDLLLVFFASDGNPTITFPEGWTELFDKLSALEVRLVVWYRVADGEEGATITVTTSNIQMTAHTSYRITGYSGVPECGDATTGNSTTPDPPSLTPSWGAKDTLWFAVCGYDANKTVTAYPTDYTNGRNDFADSLWGCGVGSARRELNAESENPNVFTISASEQWVANTIAIQPVAFVLHEWTGSDSIAIGEALVKTPTKVVSDSIALTDVVKKEFYKTLSDAIAFTDVWEGYKLIAKILSDGIAIGEALVKTTSKVVSDGVAFTDTLLRRVEKVITDGITIGEVLRKDIAKVLVDGIAFKDIVTRFFERVFTDGIKFRDILYKWRWLAPTRLLQPTRTLPPTRSLKPK